MAHDWIFEVLRDLKAYSLANGLPALAAKAEEAIRTAELEISARENGGAGTGGSSAAGSGLKH